MAHTAAGASLRTAWGKVPPHTRALLFGVAAAVVFWAGLVAFVLPRRAARLQLDAEIKTLVPGVETLRQQIVALKNAARGEEALQRELAETRRQLEETLARVPEHREIAAFLRNLTAPESEDGVVFLSITPLPPEKLGELQELPFTLELEGTYQSLTRYLARLESLPRLVTVQRVTLGGAAGATSASGALRASISAATYLLEKNP